MQTSGMRCRAAAVSVLGVLWVITAALACPEKCWCKVFSDSSMVSCSLQELKGVPINIPPKTTSLSLTFNNIQNLTVAAFSDLINLGELDLANNNISVLPDGVFSNLTSLEILRLDNNNIGVLPDGVFSSLASLKKLRLANNNIRVLPGGVFSNLTSLELLDLQNNNISVLPDGIFSKFTSLERLYLQNNPISVFSDGVFSHLTSLEWLLLASNNIRVLPDGVFSNLTSLKRLRLYNNNISVLPDGIFSHLLSLEILDLQKNHISSLPGGFFSNLTSLGTLNLQNNDISVLPDGIFSHLLSLELLGLQNSNISVLPDGIFSNLISLETLDLQKNDISSLPDGVFSNLTSLERLYLQNNRIRVLPDEVFSHLLSLKWLRLEKNSISVLSDRGFSHLTSLKWLRLDNNNISVLPDGVFSNLTNLDSLYLQNNHISVLPDGIFSHLTSLKRCILSNNSISDISTGDFLQLRYLKHLLLKNNNIQNLPIDLFSTQTTLEILDLSDNYIEVLPGTVFSNLTSLTRLNLSNNNIQTLSVDITRLPQLTTLAIGGNPWRCDCRLQNLMTPRLRALIQGNPTCSSPPHMEGVALPLVVAATVCHGHGDCTLEGEEGTCACNEAWTGPYCDKEANLAYGKTATQSSTYTYNGVSGGPEKAVDGYRGTDARRRVSECARTKIEYQPWWKVDLAGFYTVSRVSVLNRGGSRKLRAFALRNFMVRVGPNENFTQNDQCGQTYSTTPTAGQTIVVHCDPPIPGRYVSVHIMAMGQRRTLTVCEVEVYVTGVCCDHTIRIKNGQVKATDGYCPGNDIQFSCDTGYELVGNSFAICRDEGWDRRIPTCQRICCDAITEITNGQVNATDGYCSGNNIQFSCNPGYELVGNSNASCQEDKSWGRQIPTCRKPPTEESLTSIEAIVGGASTGIVAALIVAISVFVAFFLRRRNKKREDCQISIHYFVPDDKIIHRRRIQEMVPLVPARPEFPGFEVDHSRVTLGERIGSGAFGLAYRATLTTNEESEDVVVKTVKDNASEEDKLSFLQEIRAVVDLGVQKNLLGLVGCCTVVRDHLYLITEFMPYGDLKGFLRKCQEGIPDGPRDDIYNFEVMQMYQVGRQIARGMDHIARSRYIHGDLAARNVLVGEKLTVKISDFGLAEDIYSRGYRRQNRLQKVPWKWMAPERLQGGEAYTAQSDVWSFGIVLYEISTLGGDPYPDMAIAHLQERLQTGFRMSKPGGCPAGMYDLMLQCWRWQPAERPSFRTLELDLDKQLAFYGPEYATPTPCT